MTKTGNMTTVVITGCSSGIGMACALHLDSLGLTVFAGVRNQVDGDVVRNKASERLTPILIDVTKANSIASAAVTVASAVGNGGLHGLVNNAGIVVSGPLECVPIDELRRQLEVNVVGQIAVTQAFAPLLRKSHGRIVNMGSDCGRIAAPFLGPYCASKYALEALTDALRMELRPHGVQVCIIEPGNINTPIWNKSLIEGDKAMEALPDEAKDLYGVALAKTRETATRMAQASIPAMAVAKVVARALTARRPKVRYVVGHDAWLRIALARFLPTRLLDRLIMRSLGLR